MDHTKEKIFNCSPHAAASQIERVELAVFPDLRTIHLHNEIKRATDRHSPGFTSPPPSVSPKTVLSLQYIPFAPELAPTRLCGFLQFQDMVRGSGSSGPWEFLESEQGDPQGVPGGGAVSPGLALNR